MQRNSETSTNLTTINECSNCALSSPSRDRGGRTPRGRVQQGRIAAWDTNPCSAIGPREDARDARRHGIQSIRRDNKKYRFSLYYYSGGRGIEKLNLALSLGRLGPRKDIASAKENENSVSRMRSVTFGAPLSSLAWYADRGVSFEMRSRRALVRSWKLREEAHGRIELFIKRWERKETEQDSCFSTESRTRFVEHGGERWTGRSWRRSFLLRVPSKEWTLDVAGLNENRFRIEVFFCFRKSTPMFLWLEI